MPSRRNDARRSDVSVARFVLADENSAMATDPPAPRAAEPPAPSAAPAAQPPPPQPSEKKDKEKEKEALTIEVCTSTRSRLFLRMANHALSGTVRAVRGRDGDVGSHAAQIHHHPSSKGRAAAQHADTSQCHLGADQGRHGIHQPPGECVRTESSYPFASPAPFTRPTPSDRNPPIYSANEFTVASNKKTIMPADVFKALDEIEYGFMREKLEAEFASENTPPPHSPPLDQPASHPPTHSAQKSPTN